MAFTKKQRELMASLGIEAVKEVPDKIRAPHRGKNYEFWNAVKELCDNNLNQWFKVKNYKASVTSSVEASKIRKGERDQFPEGEYEVEVRKSPVLDENGELLTNDGSIVYEYHLYIRGVE